MEKLYTVSELSRSRRLPYKYQTIRKLIKDGKLKAIRLSPRKTVVKESEVQRFIKELENGKN